jgi:hypothetical protein
MTHVCLMAIKSKLAGSTDWNGGWMVKSLEFGPGSPQLVGIHTNPWKANGAVFDSTEEDV